MQIAFVEAANAHDLSAALPMFYLQIKSYLLKYAGHADSISMSFHVRPEDIPDGVDIVGVSSTTQNFRETIEYGRRIRERHPKALLVLGGHHISFLPQTLPPEYDLGVMFEGEETFTQIVDAYEAAHGAKAGLYQLKGVVWRDGAGQIVVNPPQDLIQPLDRIPFAVMEGDEAPYLFSSRGCPYDCSFCASTAFWQTVRYFSAEYVLAQVKAVLERFPDIQQILFWDDLVVANKPRFASIVEQIERERLNAHAKFGFAVRANHVDEELCRLLARLRVSFVSFGAESGSPRVLRLLKGKSVTVEQNQKALDLLSQYGIPAVCGFVVGAPTETRDDLMATFDFVLRNTAAKKILHSAVNVLMPLPGTQMWEYAVHKKIIAEPIDWRRLQVFASYRTSRFKSIKEWSEQRLALNSYYLNEDCVPHVELLALLAELEGKLDKVYAELRAAAEHCPAPLPAADVPMEGSSPPVTVGTEPVPRTNDHLEKDRSYHEAIAAEYDAVVVAPRVLTNDLLFGRFGELVRVGRRMLDLGCGTGHMVLRFGSRFQQVVGIDHSPAMLSVAREKAQASGLHNAEFQQGDVFEYLERCTPGDFDFVCCVGFLHHLTPERIAAVLAGIRRALRPGGLLLFSEPIQVPPESLPRRIAAWNSQSVAAKLSYSRPAPESAEQPLDAEVLMKALKDSVFAVTAKCRNWEIFPHHLPPTLSDRLAIRLLNLCYGRSGNVMTVAARKA